MKISLECVFWFQLAAAGCSEDSFSVQIVSRFHFESVKLLKIGEIREEFFEILREMDNACAAIRHILLVDFKNI